MTHVDEKDTFDALTFSLQDELFALDADTVREILDLIPVTDVPGAREFVPGLINVRGRVVPLADLKVKFGMPQTEHTRDTRIVVIEMDLAGELTIVGLLADKVYEVAPIAGASIEDPPQIGIKWRPEFLKGIAKRDDGFVIIPNIENIFAAE